MISRDLTNEELVRISVETKKIGFDPEKNAFQMSFIRDYGHSNYICSLKGPFTLNWEEKGNSLIPRLGCQAIESGRLDESNDQEAMVYLINEVLPKIFEPIKVV